MSLNFTSASQTCAIGLDVGGTKIAAGIVAFPLGQVIHKQIIPTRPERGGEAVLSDALNLAETLLAQAQTMGFKVMGIGVGLCELVDPEGNVTSAHTIAWRGVPVQAAFSKLAPAIVESDARAPALAEAKFGAGRSYKIFAYITVGTGISYCLVQDGRPYAGARGNALILANTPLTTTCPQCDTVLAPVLEEIASGPALVSRYNLARQREPGLKAKLQTATRGEEVLAAVEAGDPAATEVVKSAGEALGVSVGWLVNMLDPEAVIVGGGLGSAQGLYWDSFVASTRRHIWSDTNRDLPIVPAALGPDAGFIGAATAIFQKRSEQY